jgi:hypothetical protein
MMKMRRTSLELTILLVDVEYEKADEKREEEEDSSYEYFYLKMTKKALQ